VAPRPQIPKQVQVDLVDEPELALDLAAFSAAYYGAQYAPILRAALRDHIDRSLEAEPSRKRLFQDARAQLVRSPAEAIRLVDRASDDGTSADASKGAKKR
jgi:hypothetical protein